MCVVTLTLILSGCGHYADAPLTRKLPSAPVSLTPVPLPGLVAGGDVRVSRFEHRQALIKANTRIVKSRAWYEQVRTGYSK